MFLLPKTAVRWCVSFCIMGFESLQPKIIKSPKWTNPLWTFWYAGRDFVKTHSVVKAKCKHLPTITSYVSPLPTKSLTLWGPRNKEYSRTLSQHNKNEEHSKEHSSFLVRWKGLEPPTYWFVASHSIQLSYWRIQL